MKDTADAIVGKIARGYSVYLGCLWPRLISANESSSKKARFGGNNISEGTLSYRNAMSKNYDLASPDMG
jgi:hypothetical protein